MQFWRYCVQYVVTKSLQSFPSSVVYLQLSTESTRFCFVLSRNAIPMLYAVAIVVHKFFSVFVTVYVYILYMQQLCCQTQRPAPLPLFLLWHRDLLQSVIHLHLSLIIHGFVQLLYSQLELVSTAYRRSGADALRYKPLSTVIHLE